MVSMLLLEVGVAAMCVVVAPQSAMSQNITTTAAPPNTTTATTTAPPTTAVYNEDVNSGPHQVDVIFQNFLQLRVDTYRQTIANTINVSSTRITFTSQGGHYGFSLGYYTIVRVVVGPRSFGSEGEPSSTVTTQWLATLGHTAGFQFDASLTAAAKASLLKDTIVPAITPPTSNTADLTNAAKEFQRIGIVDAHFVARDAILYTYKTYTTADLIYTFVYVVVGVIYGGFLLFVMFKFYTAFKLERADKRDDAKEKRKAQALKDKAELEAKVRAQLAAARGRGRGGARGGRGGAVRGGRGAAPFGAKEAMSTSQIAPAQAPVKKPIESTTLPLAARESDPIQKRAIGKAATRVVDRFHKQQSEFEKEIVAQSLRAQPSHELNSFLAATQLPPPMPAYDPFASDILGSGKGKGAGVSEYLTKNQGGGGRYASNINANRFDRPDGVDPAVAYGKSTFGSTNATQQASWGGNGDTQQKKGPAAADGGVRFFADPEMGGPSEPLEPLMMEDDGPGGFGHRPPPSSSSDPLHLGAYDNHSGGDVASSIPNAELEDEWATFNEDSL